MSYATKYGDARTYEQIKDHYQIEKELAAKLRSASIDQRRTLYTDLYNELFLRVPHHPQLTRKISPSETAANVNYQMGFLRLFLTTNSIFAEVGPGDCSISNEVSKLVKQVYAIDVSSEITKSNQRPDNFELIISDGTSVDVKAGAVDVFYSNQLMEHLHPDDAIDQLQNIYKAIASGGVYVCITPNRLTGPHDVSKYFDDEVASGFHLKEYTTSEIRGMFDAVGFSKFMVYIPIRGRFFRMPTIILVGYEHILKLLPYKVRQSLLKVKLFRVMLGSCFVGVK